MATSDVLLVLVTVPNRSVGEQIASALVKECLAACVNIIPDVTSIYRWRGEINVDPESLLLIKSRAGVLDRLKAAVITLHPYELPEIIAVKVTAGLEDYLNWIVQEVNDQ